MIDFLFSKPAVRARHYAAPMAAERERYLSHCATQGYRQRALRKTAWLLLLIVQSLSLDARRVSKDEIEQAARTRVRLIKRPSGCADARSTEQIFIKVATHWLSFLDRLAPIEKPYLPFADQIASFADYMRHERGLSAITIETRVRRIENFLTTLYPRVQDLRAICISDVDRYLIHQSEHGWSRPSMVALASDLRSFFRYTEAVGGSDSGIADAIDSPRIYTAEGLARGPTWEQVSQLLAQAEGDRAVDIRDRAILILLAIYGLRRGEVAGLRLENFDWQAEILSVERTKQQRIDRYPLIRPLGEAVVRYLREVRPACEYRQVFMALRAPTRPLSAFSITPIVRWRLAALGVSLPHSGAHCLRHACAQHLLMQGFSLKQIGDHLGHRSAETTRRYVKVDLDRLAEVADLQLDHLL